MRTKNSRKLLILAGLVLVVVVLYLVVEVNFEHTRMLRYALKIRIPKLIVMLITAFAIGAASIVFQSVIQNTIVTPCLLGMNSLYTLVHTAVIFTVGSGSILAVNTNLAFAVDLLLMGLVATAVYGFLFQKAKHNVLYILLIGTVLSSFFTSIQSTMTRMMDPNEYDALLVSLVASFSNINSEIILLSLILLVVLLFVFRRELALLDVITLGRHQAINLGVDYDRCIRKLLLGVTLCIAIATAMVGPISFLGLIIANLSRQLLKTYRHTQLICGAALFGMLVLVGGQRQRAYIAMVIAQDTEYIFLDEPTNNLDIYHATNMMKIVRRLCDELGKTVVLVLHEINYAAFYSDYICAFVDGKVAKFGTVEEVMTKETLAEIYQVDFEIMKIQGKPLSIYY